MQFVVKPANSYAGGVLRAGVVDLVVLACVLRAMTKKVVNFFVLSPSPIFSSTTDPESAQTILPLIIYDIRH